MGPRTTAPLSSRRTIGEVGAAGRRGASGLLRVRFLPAEAGPPRIAYAIPRRAGTAVARNRIRRRLRAAVDVLAPEISPGAYLVAPDPACRTARFEELVGSLRRSLEAAGALRVTP